MSIRIESKHEAGIRAKGFIRINKNMNQMMEGKKNALSAMEKGHKEKEEKEMCKRDK